VSSKDLHRRPRSRQYADEGRVSGRRRGAVQSGRPGQ
jgi:hypothetical protein